MAPEERGMMYIYKPPSQVHSHYIINNYYAYKHIVIIMLSHGIIYVEVFVAFYSVCNTSLFSGIVDGVMVTSHCFVEPSSLLVP